MFSTRLALFNIWLCWFAYYILGSIFSIAFFNNSAETLAREIVDGFLFCIVLSVCFLWDLMIHKKEAKNMSNEKVTEQPDFVHFECPDCAFDSVQHENYSGSTLCPLCASDSGHNVYMTKRTARNTDKPEGRDARKDSHG